MEMTAKQGEQVKSSERIRRRAQDAATDYVQRVVRAYPDDVMAVILFGSGARGDANEDSDLDLLVLVKHNRPSLREDLAQITWEVQFDHKVIVADIVRDLDQWQRMQTAGYPFYQSIAREGIVLWKSASAPTPA